MNILIKLTCLIGLVIAPILGNHSAEEVGLENKANTNEVKTVDVVTEENTSTYIVK
jgi:K(+)-stimulated pyrophosphate-energized sodium pump